MGSKFTKNQKLWNDMSLDLLSRLNKLNAKGVKTDIVIPKAPTTITQKQIKNLMGVSKRVEEIEKSFTPMGEDIKINKQKGKQIDINVNKKIKSRNIPYRPYIVDTILSRYAERLQEAGTVRGAEILTQFFEVMIDDYGTHQFAKILHDCATNGIHLTNEIIYDSSGAKAVKYVNNLLYFMKANGLYDKHKEMYREVMDEMFGYDWEDPDNED